MMDCSAYKELSGLRPEDLSPDEASSLRGHLDRCDLCRSEQLADEELLALVDRLPTLESDITAADVRRMDGLESSLAEEDGARPAPPARRWLPVLLAVAAAAALALLIVPGRFTRGPDPAPQRLKGAGGGDVVPASLDLQFSVEGGAADGGRVIAGADGAAVSRDRGLLFGVQVEGKGRLSLFEIDPQGAARALMPSDHATWSRGPSGVLTLTDAAGQPLAYRPDGPPGAYRYVALMTDDAGRTPGPEDVATLRRGGDVEGIELLASDEFEVQWTAGDERGSTGP